MRKQYITYLPSLSLVVVTSNGSKKYSLSLVASGGSTLFSLPLYRCQRKSRCRRWWQHSLVLSLSLSCRQWKWKQKIISPPQPSLLSPSLLSSMAAKNNLSPVVASGSSSNLYLSSRADSNLSLSTCRDAWH